MYICIFFFVRCVEFPRESSRRPSPRLYHGARVGARLARGQLVRCHLFARARHCPDHRSAHRRAGPAELRAQSPRAVRRRRRRRQLRGNQHKKCSVKTPFPELQLDLRRTADSHFARHFIFHLSASHCAFDALQTPAHAL